MSVPVSRPLSPSAPLRSTASKPTTSSTHAREAPHESPQIGAHRRWPDSLRLPNRAAYLLPAVLAIVGVALILVGIFGVSLPATDAASPPASAPAAPAGTLQVSLPASTVRCPQLGAWSLDDERIAIVGVPRACNQAPGTGANLVLMDATTGKVLATYALAPLIVPSAVPSSVQANKSLMAGVNLTFARLLWSPDRKTIALAFATSASTTDTSGHATTTPYGAGLLLLDTTKGTSQIIPALVDDGPRAVPFQSLQLVRWDIAHRTAGFIWLPQAAGYTWQNDILTPISPLAANTSATPASGADVAAAGADSRVWSGASVMLAVPCAGQAGSSGTSGAASTATASYYLYQSSLAAWSPDGNVLITGDWGQARLGVAPSSAAVSAVRAGAGCTTSGAATELPVMPVLNAGMTQALGGLASQAHHPAAALAWSPDGRYVVSLPLAMPTAAGAALAVYDSANGRSVASVPASALYHGSNGQSASAEMAPRLLWSPDGRSLMVLDSGYHLVTLLGPRALNA